MKSMSGIGSKLSQQEIQGALNHLTIEELGRVIDYAMDLKKRKVQNSQASTSSQGNDVYFGNRTDYGNSTIGIVIRGKPDHASYVQNVNVRIRVKTPFSSIFHSYIRRTKVTQGSLNFFTPEGKLITKLDTPESLGLTEGSIVDVKFARLH